jgi:hypothetical protein
VRRVPAAALEKLVREKLTRLTGASQLLSWDAVKEILQRVELRERSIQLVLNVITLLEPHEPVERAFVRLCDALLDDRLVVERQGVLRLICDQGPRFRGGKAGRRGEVSTHTADEDTLRQKLKLAHRLLEAQSMSPLAPETHALAEAPPYQRERRLMALGLLSPALQRGIAEGRLGEVLASTLLAGDMPLAWKDQAAVLGF